MNSDKVSVMGIGFIGSKYCDIYPDSTYREAKSQLIPKYDNVLYTRSTVSNYNVLDSSTLKLDIETNLCHLMDVLPNVSGEFNFLSSWFCYGFNQEFALNEKSKEDSHCNPTGFYSITKRTAEQLIQSYHSTAEAGLVSGPSCYRILRLCNVIGNDPRANKQKNALEYIISRILKNETINIYEGSNFRNYLHIEDVCRAINLCIKNGEINSIYNIGSSESVKLIDIVNYVIDKTNSKSEVKIIKPPKFHDIVQVSDFWMDVEKITKLGFYPKYNLWQSLDKILENLK